ncbi:MAG: AMIN domain-containing protein, partial [Deltaproteobacteria bacterium]|nr:AMIN domain-containing protein [Deltaproteobacteria bacterium]
MAPFRGQFFPFDGNTGRTRMTSRIRHLVFGLILLAHLITPSGVSAVEARTSSVTVTQLAFKTQPGCMKVMIHVSGPVAFRRQRLTHPERWYMDLENTTLGKGVERLYAVGNPLVKAIRSGQFDPRTVRIVLDLNNSNDHVDAVFQKDPDRIVIQVCEEPKKKPVPREASAPRNTPLIPESQWITDFEARLALARILSYDNTTLDASLRE